MSSQIVLEKFIEEMKVDLYPVTLLKFILNKKKILKYFLNANDPEFKLKSNKQITMDHKDCELCKSKESEGILCRQHTSIHRTMSAKKVVKDTDTDIYFFKNEIFKKTTDKLVIIYCPHTKLLKGEVTDEKVRKINPITIIDNSIELPNYEIVEISSSVLLNSICRCWFNNEFSILSIPNNSNSSDWAITSNK